MKQFITALYAATLLIVALPAQAQDGNAALYGPVPPADAAFVRVLNLTGELAEVAVSGKSRTQSVGAGRLGNFLFMEPGPRKISVGTRHFEDTLAAHAALTLVFDGQSLKPILETFSENPKKALVSFYNLTEQPLALRTADGRYTLIDNVAAQQAGSRSVNEIKVGLAAYTGDHQLVGFDEAFLKKGRSYSYVVIAGAEGYRTLSLANALDAIE